MIEDQRKPKTPDFSEVVAKDKKLKKRQKVWTAFCLGHGPSGNWDKLLLFKWRQFLLNSLPGVCTVYCLVAVSLTISPDSSQSVTHTYSPGDKTGNSLAPQWVSWISSSEINTESETTPKENENSSAQVEPESSTDQSPIAHQTRSRSNCPPKPAEQFDNSWTRSWERGCGVSWTYLNWDLPFELCHLVQLCTPTCMYIWLCIAHARENKIFNNPHGRRLVRDYELRDQGQSRTHGSIEWVNAQRQCQANCARGSLGSWVDCLGLV